MTTLLVENAMDLLLLLTLDQQHKLSRKWMARSGFDNHANRELSSESLNDQNQVESKLAISSQNLEELQMEISHMRGVAADQQIVVSELLAKSQKLEDSLITAIKLTSLRHQQLAKLHKSYLQVRYYDERLKSCEQELQLLCLERTGENEENSIYESSYLVVDDKSTS